MPLQIINISNNIKTRHIRQKSEQISSKKKINNFEKRRNSEKNNNLKDKIMI